MITKNPYPIIQQAVVESGQLVDISYFTTTSTTYVFLAGNKCNSTDWLYLKTSMNWGIAGGDTLHLRLLLNDNEVYDITTTSADEWYYNNTGVNSTWRLKAGNWKLYVKTIAGETAFIKDLKIWCATS